MPVADTEENDGYKVAAKVSMGELMNKDKDDASLNAYKESLLGKSKAAVPHDPNDKRRVIVKDFRVVVAGRPDIILDVNDKSLKDKPYNLKEGSDFKLQLKFWVQHDIVMALKFKNVTSKMGINVAKDDFVVGSFAPQTEEYTWSSVIQTAPDGWLARGNYSAHGKFCDDDGHIFAEFDYAFKLSKDW